MEATQQKWKRNTILFLVSQCITLLGSMIVQMAIIWFVTLKTSSGVWVAAFSICAYLPQFLISFIGGVWADRYSRKKLMIVADAVIAAATIIMFALMPFIAEDTVLLGALLVMAVVRSLGAGIQTAAIGISILCFVRIPWQKPQQMGQQENVSVFADMKTGIRYAFGDKMIGRILVVYGLFILLCVPAGFMAGLLVSRMYGDTYWYLTAVEFVGFAGMAIGGALLGIWGGFKSRVRTLAAGLFVLSIMTIGMGAAPFFLLYLVLMFVYNIAITVIQTAVTTIMQENVASSMQGRVFGLMGAMYSGFLPVGMAVFGPMADVLPLQWIMVGISYLFRGVGKRQKCGGSSAKS